MTKFKLIEVNCETGQEILRDMTDEEQAQREADITKSAAEELAKLQAEEQAAAKRQALLDKLGITEDEAKLLLGGN